MTKQFGFTLIEILVALAVFILTAGGVVVWERKVKPSLLFKNFSVII